jgi:hypothetical protein
MAGLVRQPLASSVAVAVATPVTSRTIRVIAWMLLYMGVTLLGATIYCDGDARRGHLRE